MATNGKKTYEVTFGAGFGSCNARSDTVLTVRFESGAKTESGLKGAAHKAAGVAFYETFGRNVDNLGYVCEKIEEVL